MSEPAAVLSPAKPRNRSVERWRLCFDPRSDLCVGCGRKVEEIAGCPMSETGRLAVMAGLEARLVGARPRRPAARAGERKA